VTLTDPGRQHNQGFKVIRYINTLQCYDHQDKLALHINNYNSIPQKQFDIPDILAHHVHRAFQYHQKIHDFNNRQEKGFSADNINISGKHFRERIANPEPPNETSSSQSYHIFGVRKVLVHPLPCGMGHINIL
jgi:hypothetical protein